MDQTSGDRPGDGRQLLLDAICELPVAMAITHQDHLDLNDAARRELGVTTSTIPLEVIFTGRRAMDIPSGSQWEMPHPYLQGRVLGCTLYAHGEAGRQVKVLMVRDLTALLESRERAHREAQTALIGQMAMGVAHEIRNPVAAIISLVEALAAEMDPGDPRNDYLMRMRRMCDRLSNLTTTTLRFGRMPLPRRRAIEARKVVELALDALRPRLPGGPVAVEEDGSLLLGDEQQLAQVFEILLDNALDVVGPDRIQITIQAIKSGVECAVVDGGPGIRPEDMKRLATPFFTTKARGTGLGLAIASRVLELHGSTLQVRANPGGGSRFFFVVSGGRPGGER